MTLGRAVDLGMAIEIAIAMGMAMFFCLGVWAWELAGALMELNNDRLNLNLRVSLVKEVLIMLFGT